MPNALLTIGNQRYPLADLSNEARQVCRQIQYCQQHISRLQRELALLQQMRTQAADRLSGLLPAATVADDGEADAVPATSRRRYWPSAPACKPRRP